MSFSGDGVTLTVLVRLDLNDKIVTLCDGGVCVFEGETYTSEDSDYGSITEFENFSSGIADEAPAFEIAFNPPDIDAATALASPLNQSRPVKFYIASVNRSTGAVISSQLKFRGIIDYTSINGGRNSLVTKLGLTTEIDRFLNTNKGNKLNGPFHRRIYPGELGLDNTTGTTIPAPWGQEATRTSTASGGGGINSTTQNPTNYQRR